MLSPLLLQDKMNAQTSVIVSESLLTVPCFALSYLPVVVVVQSDARIHRVGLLASS